MAAAKAQTRFPGESAEYRRARNALLRAEVRLRRSIEAVATQRRRLPLGGAVKTDYVFDGTGGTIRLSELFVPGKRTLFVYSFMYPESPDSNTPCPSCTFAHIFVKRGKRIHHSWSSELFFAKPDPGEDMRHVDFMWPVWSILDLTPEGRGHFHVELEY